MRAMSGARAREAVPLLYFMLIPHFSQGRSPLHLAAGSGRFGCCYYAAGSGRLEIVRLLVSAGADLNIRDL
jgi:ankyrin repeat protein